MAIYVLMSNIVRTILRAFKLVFVVSPLLLIEWVRRVINAAYSSVVTLIARADAIRHLTRLSFIHNLLVIKPSTRAIVLVVDPKLIALDDGESLRAIRKVIYERLQKAGCEKTEVIILYSAVSATLVDY